MGLGKKTESDLKRLYKIFKGYILSGFSNQELKIEFENLFWDGNYDKKEFKFLCGLYIEDKLLELKDIVNIYSKDNIYIDKCNNKFTFQFPFFYDKGEDRNSVIFSDKRYKNSLKFGIDICGSLGQNLYCYILRNDNKNLKFNEYNGYSINKDRNKNNSFVRIYDIIDMSNKEISDMLCNDIYNVFLFNKDLLVKEVFKLFEKEFKFGWKYIW